MEEEEEMDEQEKIALYQSVKNYTACGAGSKNITIALISRAVDR